MRIRTDRRLNVFEHFGGDWANENNTTRALLMALSRSPWSPTLLRVLMDLIREKVAGRLVAGGQPLADEQQCVVLGACNELLSRWPDEVDFRMQVGAASDEFKLPDGGTGVLIEIIPCMGTDVSYPPNTTSGATDSKKAAGIVDAWIQADFGEDRSLTMVIESKLYGKAGRDQIAKYLAGMGADKTTEVQVTWEDVYGLLNALPDAALADPIIADFRDFMARDPKLVGFTSSMRATPGQR
jgi:hypothetical protein